MSDQRPDDPSPAYPPPPPVPPAPSDVPAEPPTAPPPPAAPEDSPSPEVPQPPQAPPVYAPPAPAAYAPAPGQPYAAPTPPKKKNTALIVGIVVAVILFCCCATAAGGLLFLAPTSSTSSSEQGSEPEESLSELPASADDSRMEEWDAWSPELDADALESAPSSKQGLIDEALAAVAPGFSATDVIWYEGSYDEQEDWYYSDEFFVKAKHDSSDAISAAVHILIETDEMASLDIDYEPYEGDSVTDIDNGTRVLEYESQWLTEGFDLAADDDVALWKQLGKDWPEGVVMYAYDSDTTDGAIDVEITKWDVYELNAACPYVLATYENDKGTWTLTGWEYVYPEEEENTST